MSALAVQFNLKDGSSVPSDATTVVEVTVRLVGGWVVLPLYRATSPPAK